MSYDLHEAFSLDSFQTQLNFWDDFEGDSLKAIWTSTLVGGGTGAVIDAMDGGIFRLGTPTASDESKLDWGGATPIRSLHVDKKVTMETKIRANGGVTDTIRYIMTLYFDAGNRIDFYHGVDSLDITIQCVNGGAPTSADSGINIDADYHVYRIECFPADEVHFYIDGVECANSPITTNIPDDAADYLMPRFYIATNADTDPATSMDVDYVAWGQLI